MRIFAGFLLAFVGVVSALAGTPETKIQLTCMEVSEQEAGRLLTHYCRDFKIVAKESKDSDFTLVLMKKPDDPLPYVFIVMDSVDAEAVEASQRSQLSGAIKDACSAMHIRIGESQPAPAR